MMMMIMMIYEKYKDRKVDRATIDNDDDESWHCRLGCVFLSWYSVVSVFPITRMQHLSSHNIPPLTNSS